MKTEEQVKNEIVASKWSVKTVKFMKGHDAQSMECALYCDGKKVATVWDDSWGGGFQYTWVKNVEEEFKAFAKTFTVPSEWSKDGLTYNMDIVVDILVTRFQIEKEAQKLMKRVSYVKDGAIYQLQAKHKPTADVLKAVKDAKWWKDDYIMLNELPVSEVVKYIK